MTGDTAQTSPGGAARAGDTTGRRRTIGILGGVGPFAGVELARRVLCLTQAQRDQEHLPLVLVSVPGEMPDRTDFLLGKEARNPGDQAVVLIRRLESSGAGVIGVACNAMHAHPIWNEVQEFAARQGLVLVNMVDETCRHIAERGDTKIQSVGILATTGTVRAGVYQESLADHGIEALVPNDALQDTIHRLVYDSQWGLKARGDASHPKVLEGANEVMTALERRGAMAFLLACTELSLLGRAKEIRQRQVPLVDALSILAAALVRECDQGRLRKDWRALVAEGL